MRNCVNLAKPPAPVPAASGFGSSGSAPMPKFNELIPNQLFTARYLNVSVSLGRERDYVVGLKLS